ncbi:MAG: hypothetical protein MK116_12915 [Phycisphaerales bacterium]|nr:hypothetical protein [Phycisphaerales bacterium]
MDCGTVAVSGFTFPVGLMLVGVAVTAGAWMAIRKLRSKASVMSRVQPA